MKSSFKYQITQSVQLLPYKIKVNNGKKWTIEEGDSYILLKHIKDPTKVTCVVLSSENVLEIVISGGFRYIITNLPKDGAEVIFYGPVNALEAQALKPKVTYVPNTIVAKTEDMEDWVDIDEFMEDRAMRNADNQNPQDKNGWRVNMKFNNEFVPY